MLAGLPTCVGTLINGPTVSPYFSLMFYALVVVSLLYVIFSLITIFYTASRRIQSAYGVFTGISLMYLTAMVLTIVPGSS